MPIKDRFYKFLASQLTPYFRQPKEELYSPASLISGFSYPGEEQNVWNDLSHFSLERLGATSPLVKPNIDMIAKAIARADVEMLEIEDEETDTWKVIPNHKFLKFVNTSPMPDMGSTFAWWYQTIWLMLHGEAYWMIVPNGFNELSMLVPIPAYMIRPIPWKSYMGGEPRLIGYYSYTPNDPNYPERLEASQVVFHRIPNPFNPIRGLSLLSVYLMMLKTVTEADKFDYDDYVHGLTLSKLISLRADLSDRDFLKALADWRQASIEGARVRIIRGGDASAQDLSTRRGEEGQNVHERARYYADRVWGIPEGLRDKNATEASAKVADEVYQRETIKPLLNLIAEDLNAQLVHPLYGENYKCRFIGETQDDIDNIVKQKELDRKTMTYNEAREADGREPIADEVIGNLPFTAVNEAIKIIMQSQYGQVKDINVEKDETLQETEEQKAIRRSKLLKELTEEQIAELAKQGAEDYVREFNNRNPKLNGILEASINGKGE